MTPETGKSLDVRSNGSRCLTWTVRYDFHGVLCMRDDTGAYQRGLVLFVITRSEQGCRKVTTGVQNASAAVAARTRILILSIRGPTANS